MQSDGRPEDHAFGNRAFDGDTFAPVSLATARSLSYEDRKGYSVMEASSVASGCELLVQERTEKEIARIRRSVFMSTMMP